MLAKEHRLPVRSHPEPPLSSYRSLGFSAKLYRTTAALSRFGFVVSKKVDTRATVRNQLKRQLRSVVEELLPRVKPGYDILFIIHSGIKTQTPEERREQATAFFTQKHLI